MADLDLMTKIVSLCKRRGFVFQSSEIYGGLKSSYDYGPLGVELKRNIASEWWRDTVYERENVVGMDGSIMMHSDVWKSSGHLEGFSDPLVDCKNCKERFRADKQPTVEPGTKISWKKGGIKKGEVIEGEVGKAGYVCPNCGSSDLSEERQFNGMFRTGIGAVDPLMEFANEVEGKNLSKKELLNLLNEKVKSICLSKDLETAQAMFVQFTNVQQTTSQKIPFGIAQIGKAFRNEIVVEHFIFRSLEFEQMELEFFCEPGTEGEWITYWKNARLNWYKKYANKPDNFVLRQHDEDELAHYSNECYDIEYNYPWGFDELEGVASRTDYDPKHQKGSGSKLSYFDQNKEDPNTGKKGWRYVPYVIEPSAGLTRATLCFLLDAYDEEKSTDAKGNEKTRVVLRLHPRLAPFKAAILPLMKKDGHPEKARALQSLFRSYGINVSYDDNQSIGKRYAKHDEIGTPYCLTVDNQTLEDDTVTIRDRDTTDQQRIPISEAIATIQKKLADLA